MNSVIERARSFAFHSFGPVEPDDLERAVVHHQSNHCLLLSVAEENRIHLYWACDSFDELTRVIQAYVDGFHEESVYVEFIPKSFSSSLESMGFTEHSEYIDFWLRDLKPAGKPLGEPRVKFRKAMVRDFPVISSITRQCAEQSRGFTVETPESLLEWNSGAHNRIVVASSDNQILGHALLSLYGFDTSEGTVLWMREIAVRPESQRQGVGRRILVYSMNWGCRNGATRSFLHCDSKNDASIQLCESYGYRRTCEQGQLNMIHAKREQSPNGKA